MSTPPSQAQVASPSASVVICAYTEDRWDDLAVAVRSALMQDPQPAEVIVVSDHNARLLDRVRRELPEAVAVPNHEQKGLSGARNSGVAVARGDVIAFLDDDAEATPGWLAHLLAGYRDRRVACVGGAVEPRWPVRRPSTFPLEFDWVVGCSYRGLPSVPAVVRNVIGANMSFRRDVFEHVGGFRTDIGRVGKRPVGCEETELCIRLRQRRPDAVVLFEPRARVAHRVMPERTRWRYFRARCYGEGISKAIVAKHVGADDGLAAERSYATRTLPRGIADGVIDTFRGDPAGAARAAGIVIGLAATLTGYMVGSASAHLPFQARPHAADA
jgi:glycosyltransferase involved in cell wall biosynthesis